MHPHALTETCWHCDPNRKPNQLTTNSATLLQYLTQDHCPHTLKEEK